MTYGLAYNEIQEVVKSTRNGSLQYAIHLIIPRFGSLLIQVCLAVPTLPFPCVPYSLYDNT